MSKPTVMLSGGMDPCHIGHLAMMRDASLVGRVGVILNSDDWLRRKKGFVFMPWDQRACMLEAIEYVNFVVCADDSDDTVCAALKEYKPDYFANGGDRKKDNIPEYEVCQQLGINLLFGVGGGKAASSSLLVENAREVREKQWGNYVVLYNDKGIKVKILTLAPGKSISLQRHFKRTEHWHVTSGTGEAAINSQLFPLKPGSSLDVGLEEWHRMWNTGDEPLIIHEVQQGAECVEDDIERME